MALNSIAVTVATTPTKLCTIDTAALIQNKDAASIFVDGPAVTTSTGLEIPTTTTGSVQVRAKGNLYAISAAGTSAGAVRVLSS
jgi:hypothetical protein